MSGTDLGTGQTAAPAAATRGLNRTHDHASDGDRSPHHQRRPIAATALLVAGKVLIGVGVLTVLFVVYQLWGTNLIEARSQRQATRVFEEQLAAIQLTDPAAGVVPGPPVVSTPPTLAPPSTAAPTDVGALLQPVIGEPVAEIRIPKIDLVKVVVEGVGPEELKKGPGHFETSPLPGQAGNAAIAGHRTTYGGPFEELDQLAPGDEIRVTTLLGTATYVVDRPPFVVEPEQVEVLNQTGDNRLTLTTCHPKYSAAQRLIVTATLIGSPLSGPPGLAVSPAPPSAAATAESNTPDTVSTVTGREPEAVSGLEAGLGWDRRAVPGVIVWGLLTAGFASVVMSGARRWCAGAARRRIVYALSVVPAGFLLYAFFERVNQLLPAY